jgi:hypothetical protein
MSGEASYALFPSSTIVAASGTLFAPRGSL